MTTKHKILLLCIVLTAIFFRLYRIADIQIDTSNGTPHISIEANMPGGLFPDEAANGIDIISMEQGQLQPFYERGNGREALFFYMIWAVVKIFGFGVWQHHIVSAIVGILATLVTFFATKQLFSLGKKFEHAIPLALLSSFFMATNGWHTVLSRTAFRANLIPLFTILTVYFMLKTFKSENIKKQYWFASLFGASLALGFYTYIAYRIFAPILAVALAWPLLAYLWETKRLSAIKKEWVFSALFAAAAFVIFISPLAHYFLTHPGSFVGRSGQVSVFNPELNHGNLIGTIVSVSKDSFLGFFTEGDLNWRHNLSGLPFLSTLVSPLFAVGLVITLLKGIVYFFRPIKYKEGWPYFLLSGWFFGMLVPVITTAEGIPHGLRSIGTIPAVFMICAVGAHAVYMAAKKILAYKQSNLEAMGANTSYYKNIPLRELLLKSAVSLLLICYFTAIPAETFANYFVKAYNDPSNFYYFRSDLTTVSDYLKEFGNKKSTYLVLDKFSVQTPDYLTVVDPKHLEENSRNRPYVQVDPEQVYNIKNDYVINPADQVVFTQSSIFDIKKFKEYNPEFKLILEKRNKFGQAVLAVYQQP